jgi:CBS domain-containing membrane protein
MDDSDPIDKDTCSFGPMDISDDDVIDAMRQMKAYLDITTGDFKEIYRYAYGHALRRITKSVTAGDVMTRDVVVVARGMPLKDVARTMAAHSISGVPVVDELNRVQGIISERDFLAGLSAKETPSFMALLADCLESAGCVAITMRKQKAGDIMTTPPVTVETTTPVSDIARIFTEKKINRVPVVDGDGKLVGMVSRGDIVHHSFPGAG